MEVTMPDFMDAVDKIMGVEKEEEYKQETGVMFRLITDYGL